MCLKPLAQRHVAAGKSWVEVVNLSMPATLYTVLFDRFLFIQAKEGGLRVAVFILSWSDIATLSKASMDSVPKWN